MFFNQTTECDGSFVKIASKDAVEMATNTLAWVKKLRADQEGCRYRDRMSKNQ